jgi:hypothetical protein
MLGMSERSRQFFHVIAALFGLSAVVEGFSIGGAIGWGMVVFGSTSIVAAFLHWRSRPEAR